MRLWLHPHEGAHKGFGFLRIVILDHDGFYIMKPESPLLACFAKIKWAETEINNFERRITDLFKPPPKLNIFQPQPFPGDRPRPPPKPYPTGFYKSASHIDSNGVEVWRFVIPEIPTDFNVTVGNILHNLRSPLDQMLSAVALLTHKSAHQVAFPFGRTQDEFVKALGKQKKLPADAIQMIEALKPYKAKGNALLYAIHALNNPDKHRPGLVPINLKSVASVDAIGIWKGMLLTFGPRAGRHFVLDENGDWSQSKLDQTPGLEIINGEPRCLVGMNVPKPGALIPRIYNQTRKNPFDTIPNLGDWAAKTRLPPGAPKDDMEIATAIPGTDFEAEVEPSLDIALGDIEGFERQHVVAVLHQMRQLVERILLTFKGKFFP